MITIHRALTELKTIEDRISSKINTGVFIGCKSKGKVNTHDTEADFKEKIISSFNSISDLIQRQHDLKRAIIKSNAETTIKVGETKITVAEAIAYKLLMASENKFKAKLMHDYTNAKISVENLNKNVEDNALRMGQAIDAKASTDKNKNSDSVNVVMEHYVNNNKVELFDPLKIEKKADKLSDKIEDFKLNIDAALSESNALTNIEV